MIDNLTEVPQTLEEMSLKEAKKVLSGVVLVNESGIKLDDQGKENLEEALGHSSAEVAQALVVVADNLFSRWNDHQGGLEKPWKDDIVRLTRVKVDVRNRDVNRFTLTLARQKGKLFVARESIVDTTVRLDKNGIKDGSMQDYRQPNPRQMTEEELFRNKWRGVRWLASNLLHWRDDFKLPEELSGGTIPVPSSETVDHPKPRRVINLKALKPRF